MIPRPLAELGPADLQELLTAAVAEGTTLDYKSDLPADSPRDRQRFLYDVTALANTLGGDLVYGIRERKKNGQPTGVPEAVIGLDAPARDTAQSRLEQIIGSGVEPRIPRVAMRWIDHPSADRGTLILRVPRSMVGPHMVVLGGERQPIYGRGISNNYIMDVRTLRTAFEMSGNIASRLRSFRAERMERIRANALSLPGTARLVLHVVPISAFELGAQIDVSAPPDLRLPTGSVQEGRHNVEGYVQHSKNGYVQLLRSGAVEAVDCHLAGSVADGPIQQLPSELIETRLVTTTRDYIETLMRHYPVISPPFFAALTLLGLGGVGWAAGPWRDRFVFGPAPAFDRSLIELPDVMIEPSDGRLWSARLRPLVDCLWQAAGCPGSPHYAPTGEWKVLSGV